MHPTMSVHSDTPSPSGLYCDRWPLMSIYSEEKPASTNNDPSGGAGESFSVGYNNFEAQTSKTGANRRNMNLNENIDAHGVVKNRVGILGAIADQGSQQESIPKDRDLLEMKAKRAEEKRKRKEAALLREKVRQQMEASEIEQDIVLGSSLITYGAGLDVRSVIAGFDLCRVTIKNLPRNAKQEDIVDIFMQQSIARSSFFVGPIKYNGSRREVTVLMKAEEGAVIAIRLKGIELDDRLLIFEVSGETSRNTMARNSESLIVYWRAPSETFIATYSSVDEVQRKISELDRTIYNGQRIRASTWRDEFSIKLIGFPIGTLLDHDLVSFSGSDQIRAATATSHGLQSVHDILYRHLQQCLNVKIETYQHLTPVDGKVGVKVQFETWEDAKSGYESINDQRLQRNSPTFHALLPDPHEYKISIPKQQYDAQRRQWDSLSEITPDRDAHVQTHVNHRGDVSIQVLGQDKKEVGSLKVRVEHMVAGERLDPEFWHPSFLAPNQRVFFDHIYETSGVYVRADLKTRSLKVYGAMIEEARRMIKDEIERLTKLETTELLSPASIGFFVRGGLDELKDILGEENATMSFGSGECHITVKGGEEGRRELHRLITESRTGASFVDQTLPEDIGKEACPICTDEISHPEQLGCGHTYCSECLRHYLESAPYTKTFPLGCIGDEDACKVPIPIRQIRRFLQPQVFQALIEVAFRSYLDQQAAQELKFCMTPDCQQIYRHSAEPRIIQCPSCFLSICSACDEEVHEGMTCQERRHRKTLVEQDRLFDEWVGENGKRCPECRRAIEKDDGCNHMTCLCGAHFCWRCERTFDSNEIYQHLTTEHGGFYE